MIDKRTSPYNINVNIDVPHNDYDIITSLNNDLEEIRDKYLGMPNNETIIMAMEYDLRKLLEKPEYRGIMISNDEFYNTEIWDLNRILEEYQKHYPERFDQDKKEYTNIEVNNILFDLNIAKVIGGYECVAVPYDIPSHNDKIFDRSIQIESPIINLGSQEDYDACRNDFCVKYKIDKIIMEKVMDDWRGMHD